jgi:hypothetical protein
MVSSRLSEAQATESRDPPISVQHLKNPRSRQGLSSCTTRFVLSPTQRIEAVTFDGNGCVAPEQ